MLYRLAFVTLTICITLTGHTQAEDKLYPIQERGLYGYINSDGKIIIRPQFKYADTFSQGLAAVRVNGYYGYINQHGELKIPAKYDYATSFYRGRAVASDEGKPCLLDLTGKIIAGKPYAAIGSKTGCGSLIMIATKKGRKGFVNPNGKLVIDTIFSNVQNFRDGLCVVTGFWNKPESRKEKTGVIDTAGKFIVPYGKYSRIGDFANGFAMVTTYAEDRDKECTGFINKDGTVLFWLPDKMIVEHEFDCFKNNTVVVDISLDTPRTEPYIRYGYPGVIDTSGRLLFARKDFLSVTPFENGVAFAEKENRKYCIINREGTIINSAEFDEIDKQGFKSGNAICDNKGIIGVVNAQGTFKGQPLLADYTFENIRRAGNIAYIMQEFEDDSDKSYYRWAILDMDNNKIIADSCEAVNFTDLKNAPVLVQRKGLLQYINAKGKIIWQQQGRDTGIKKMDIDYMGRGYFYASSPDIESLREFGGWGKSGNLSKNGRVTAGKTIKIEINVSKQKIFDDLYEGYGLSLKNNSGDTMFFDAQDSRLYMKTQARDGNGIWRDIEYLPNSWCGNSYYKLFLAGGEYWDFVMPKYYGEIKTKLRLVLEYKKQASQQKPDLLYSNEVDGFINPGQFWRKLQYYPKGIMDSYND